MERIRFNISHAKPISKKSILLFIPEILNEKIASDFKNEIEKRNRIQLDVLFVEMMKSKFKLKKFVKKHCEETIMSIQKYSRNIINYFSRGRKDRDFWEVFGCFGRKISK